MPENTSASLFFLTLSNSPLPFSFFASLPLRLYCAIGPWLVFPPFVLHANNDEKLYHQDVRFKTLTMLTGKATREMFMRLFFGTDKKMRTK
jgi:hypothetical protein